MWLEKWYHQKIAMEKICSQIGIFQWKKKWERFWRFLIYHILTLWKLLFGTFWHHEFSKFNTWFQFSNPVNEMSFMYLNLCVYIQYSYLWIRNHHHNFWKKSVSPGFFVLVLHILETDNIISWIFCANLHKTFFLIISSEL